MIKISEWCGPSRDQIRMAIHGMRNPLNSWKLSDSDFDNDVIGENDIRLMKSLSNAGPEHRKFMRQFPVVVTLTAPLYWWKEFDTYKIGTTANSTSTMHRIAAKEFELSDFSYEHLYMSDEKIPSPLHTLNATIYTLNIWRKRYLETQSKDDWWQMIQLLPSSYNQTRTVCLNYEVLRNIYSQRKDHKLDEWREFCIWIRGDLAMSWLITEE